MKLWRQFRVWLWIMREYPEDYDRFLITIWAKKTGLIERWPR